jgi:hypothetical protein
VILLIHVDRHRLLIFVLIDIIELVFELNDPLLTPLNILIHFLDNMLILGAPGTLPFLLQLINPALQFLIPLQNLKILKLMNFNLLHQRLMIIMLILEIILTDGLFVEMNGTTTTAQLLFVFRLEPF